MCIGIMAQDCKEEVLASLSTSRRFNSLSILAECMALWRAIEFGKELGLPCIQLEGDAQTIINVVTSTEACKAWYGGIVEDAKAILQHHSHWSISFVHREGNQVV